MPEAWIRYDPDRRRRHWFLTAFVNAPFVVLAVLYLLAPSGDTQDSVTPAIRLFLLALDAVCLLLLAIPMVNIAISKSLLTSDGIRFHTLFGRWFIPWNEIAAVEERVRPTKVGRWRDIRILRTNGRPRSVPGAFTTKLRDDSFDEKLRTVENYHSRALRTR